MSNLPLFAGGYFRRFMIQFGMDNLHIASAFSKGKIGGNKAGVHLRGELLTEKEKRTISKKLGFAETAFISPSSKADFKIEYFTPEEEG